MTTRVALVGGTGKLGGIIHAVIDAEPDFDVVAVLDSRSDLAELDGADLVVDASTPGVSIDLEQVFGVLCSTDDDAAGGSTTQRARRGGCLWSDIASSQVAPRRGDIP